MKFNFIQHSFWSRIEYTFKTQDIRYQDNYLFSMILVKPGLDVENGNVDKT